MLTKTLLLSSCLVSASMLVGTTGFAKTSHYYNSIQEYTAQTGKTIPKFTQSPILNKLHLPGVNERLKGVNVIVVQPQDTIGTYGGQATTFTPKSYSGGDSNGFVAAEAILKLGSDNKSIVKNIAEYYKVDKDNKTIHIRIRKGLKWSDGYPCTTEDVKFLAKYVQADKSITLGTLDYTLSVQSKYDFTVKFIAPNSFATEWLAHYNGSSLIKPAHYLKKFHIKFNKNANKQAIKAGFKNWKRLFSTKLASFSNVVKVDANTPTLHDYYLKSKNSSTFIFARNPYYWKVDTKGQQLPYIDQIKLKIVTDPEIIAARVTAGQADWALDFNTVNKIPLYKQSEKKGHIKTYIWGQPLSSIPAIQFNQTYTGTDKVGANIVKQLDFRKAFSYALNRHKINNVLYFGKGHPAQMTAHSSSKYYKKEYAEAFAQYSPKKANALLDKLGLKWDSHHSYRLRKDGKPLEYVLEYADTKVVKTLEMVQSDVAKVGIKLLLKENERSVQTARNVKGINLISTWNGDSNTDILLWIQPKFYVPFKYNTFENGWGGQWANWLVSKHRGDPIKGIEPPQEIKDLYATYLKLLNTSNEKEKIALGHKILQYQATNLLTVGLVASPPFPLVTKDNLQNIPAYGWMAWDNQFGINYAPETRYFKKPLYPAQVMR